MNIAISAESTIDLPKELIKEWGIHVVSFFVILGERSAPDGDIVPQDIYDYVERTGQLPKTSAINEYQYEDHFKTLLKDYDAVIHFSLSSKISAACSNAKKVAERLGNVYVVDTLSLSTGSAILSYYARTLINKGLDAKTIYEKCLARVPYIQASFVLDKLEYLYKGGRCTALQKFGANLLHIRPQILVVDGGMISAEKYRGKDKMVVKKYCEDTLKKFNNGDKTLAFVTATTYDDEILQLAKNMLLEAGFKKVYITTAGATITSHCGAKTLGILYINDGDNHD